MHNVMRIVGDPERVRASEIATWLQEALERVQGLQALLVAFQALLTAATGLYGPVDAPDERRKQPRRQA